MAEHETKKSPKRVLIEHREDVAKALEILFAAGYVDRKRLYFENFVRGIFFSLGTIIGATLAISLLIWLLSLIGHVPLVGPIVNETKQTIQDGTNTSN